VVGDVRIIALPQSNVRAAGENGVFPATADDRSATLRLDHRVGPTASLSLRYHRRRHSSTGWQAVSCASPIHRCRHDPDVRGGAGGRTLESCLSSGGPSQTHATQISMGRALPFLSA
jgi:hypothetical protein